MVGKNSKTLLAQAGSKLKKAKLDVSIEELFEAGVHLGHRANRWNPKAEPYIYGVEQGVHILDLEKTREKLLEAVSELKNRASLNQVILFVGTKQQAQENVKKVGESLKIPYLTERWIGGLLTNFSQIKKSIDKLSKMKTEREAGEYKKFTKKEQLLMSREIARLERLFGGVATLAQPPDVIVIIDTRHEKTAVEEARRLGIPIVGVVDTNADPSQVDFPIPANDDSVRAIEYIVGKLGEAIALGLKSKKSEALSTKSETNSKSEIQSPQTV